MEIRQQRTTSSRHSSFLSLSKIDCAQYSQKVYCLSRLQSELDYSSAFLMFQSLILLQGFRRRFLKNSACIRLKSSQKLLGYADQIRVSYSPMKSSSTTLNSPSPHLLKNKKLRKNKMRITFKTLKNCSKKVSITVDRT